jgi:hypothetical protein
MSETSRRKARERTVGFDRRDALGNDERDLTILGFDLSGLRSVMTNVSIKRGQRRDRTTRTRSFPNMTGACEIRVTVSS